MQNGQKLCYKIITQVLEVGLLSKVGAPSKNYSMIQNKYATTLKQFILSINGNHELSKEVLHKQINFICQEEDSKEATEKIYSGKNYATSLIRKMSKEINILKAIKDFEERFMPLQDKDLLEMILRSIMKGQKVQVKKMMTQRRNAAMQ